MTDLQQEIEQQGFAVLLGLFSTEHVARLVSDLDGARLQMNGSVLHSRGEVYGIRNLVDVWPTALAVAQEPACARRSSRFCRKGLVWCARYSSTSRQGGRGPCRGIAT